MSSYKSSHTDTATATATATIQSLNLNPLHLHAIPFSDHNTTAATTTTTNNRAQLAKEETKIEQAIIRAITTGDIKTLNPNSGQAVRIGGEHYLCVSYSEEAESESDYRVWEWHGHVVLCDGENGYSQEYVYGNYFERLLRTAYVEEGYDEYEERERRERGFGLVELIGGLNLTSGGIISRHLSDGFNRF